ncbi:flagellar biosynthesis anti-sigma factor FlgM [Natronospora cellulosivora (SeqCode)]
MKINGIHLNEIQKRYKQQNKQDKSLRNNRADSMSISAQAKQIKEIEKKLAEVPEIRQEKVAKLKESIAKGNYQIDTKALARKILDDTK